MAAVTQDTVRPIVLGNLRGWIGQIDIAKDGDTFESGMTVVQYAAATSTTNAAIGATISGSVVTFQTGGAEANARMIVLGQ